MRRIVFVIGMLFVAVFSHAEDNSDNSCCKAYIVGDDSGHIYYEKNIDEKLPLASVTKMMTLLVTFDEINKGQIHLNDKVVIPKEIADIQGSRIWIKDGMTFSLEDLIKASAIYSANNATQAIAYYISKGNIDKFVTNMNKKLKKLKLDSMIEYYTPTGLPPYMTGKEMDIGSARGLYLLSMHAEKVKSYMNIASMKEAKIKVGKIKNRNKLLGIEGIYGIKTGHHDTAGYNICIVSGENNIKLFVIVLGSKDETTRDKFVLSQIKKFNEEYTYRSVLDTSEPLTKVNILAGEKEYVNIYPDKDFKKIFKKDSQIQIKVKKDNFATAPIKKGAILGEYEILVDDKTILKGKLYTKQGIRLYSPFRK